MLQQPAAEQGCFLRNVTMNRVKSGRIEKRKERTRKCAYNPADLELALQDIRGGLSKKAASKKYNIPRSTLQFRLSNKFSKSSMGPTPILNDNEEQLLVKWTIECSRKGFPQRKLDVQLSVKEFLTLNKRETPFKDNMPGEGWFRAFLRRHPELSIRTSESVTSASANVGEADIRKWFHQVEEILKEEDCLGILKDPSRLYNGDESGFQLCPKTGKVLAGKGDRNVYEIDKGPAKTSITTMFAFSASGVMCPPMVIYPYQRIPHEVTKRIPDDWGVGHSPSGWMTAEVFYEYIGNVFAPFLHKQKVTFPVILFVDGHRTHLTYQLSELCSELRIILIALYPNVTRILQPLDVATFRPLKIGWKVAVLEWHKENPDKILTKEWFAPVLQAAVKKYGLERSTVSGFRACGLFPWNPDNIDFTKCLGKRTTEPRPVEPRTKILTSEHFREIVGIELIRDLNGRDGTNDAELALTRLIEALEIPTISPKVVIPQSHTSDEAGLSHVQTEERLHVELIDTNTPTQDVNPCVDEEPDIRPNDTDNSPLLEILQWPSTPKRKFKRNTERMPFVVTCKSWKALFQEKENKKKTEELAKQERKKKREERKKTDPKLKRKIQKEKLEVEEKVYVDDINTACNDKRGMCFKCTKTVGPADLLCSLCNKLFHERCVPDIHKMHIPEEDDSYVCHLCFKYADSSSGMDSDAGSMD